MDSQMHSELLNQILEEDIILLSGGESDTDLMGLDKDLNITRLYSIIDELMDGPPTQHTKHQTSTVFSTISHPLATMTTSRRYSNINTTTPTNTPTISVTHNKIQHQLIHELPYHQKKLPPHTS